jgi:hypothetical protein
MNKKIHRGGTEIVTFILHTAPVEELKSKQNKTYQIKSKMEIKFGNQINFDIPEQWKLQIFNIPKVKIKNCDNPLFN